MTLLECLVWDYILEGDYILKNAPGGDEHLRAYFHKYHDAIDDIFWRSVAKVKRVDPEDKEAFDHLKNTYSISKEPNKQIKQDITNIFKTEIKRSVKLSSEDLVPLIPEMLRFHVLGRTPGESKQGAIKNWLDKGELTKRVRARWRTGKSVFGSKVPDPVITDKKVTDVPEEKTLKASGYNAATKKLEPVEYDIGGLTSTGFGSESEAALSRLKKYREYKSGQFLSLLKAEKERATDKTKQPGEPGYSPHPMKSLALRDPDRHKKVLAHSYDYANYRRYISQMKSGDKIPSFTSWKKSYGVNPETVTPEDVLKAKLNPPPKEEVPHPQETPTPHETPHEPPHTPTSKGIHMPNYAKRAGIATAGLSALALAAYAYKKHKEKKKEEAEKKEREDQLRKLHRL